MPVDYNLNLVALSVVIAIFSAYTALDLTERTGSSQGWIRSGWLIGGASSLGIGMWAMHFVGMLALHLPVAIGYNGWIVLISVLPAILASGLVLLIASRHHLSMVSLVGASLLMGFGMTAMHYTGMVAMQLPAVAHYDLRLVTLSAVIAVIVSLIALGLINYLRNLEVVMGWQKVGAATLMGIAIPIMHYTGMAAVCFRPLPSLPEKTVVPDPLWLSSLITTVTFFVLGLALLISSETKVFDRTKELAATLEQLQQSQMQLIQTEKMSSLGQLVAGVAHEINNPISFIHGNLSHAEAYAQDLLKLLQLYQQHYPQPVSEIKMTIEEIDLDFLMEDLVKVLDSMKVGTDRICEIVLSLRNFSRLDEISCKAVDIHEGIDSTLLILGHRLKATHVREAIQVIKDYDALPPIKCYAGALNQVFMNILANAMDALEERDLHRTFQETEAQPSQITIRTGVIQGQWVEIAIADNGPGMPESVKQKIFQPFFTTKPAGKGTGMGMSISHQIITEKHAGKLKCFSTPGQGTEFVIQLPIDS